MHRFVNRPIFLCKNPCGKQHFREIPTPDWARTKRHLRHTRQYVFIVNGLAQSGVGIGTVLLGNVVSHMGKNRIESYASHRTICNASYRFVVRLICLVQTRTTSDHMHRIASDHMHRLGPCTANQNGAISPPRLNERVGIREYSNPG